MRRTRGRHNPEIIYNNHYESALAAIADRLDERGVAVSPVDHGISKALYFDDPAGNGIEVYLDTRAETGQERWEGTNDSVDPGELG